MSEGEKEPPLVIEGYQVYCNQNQDNTADKKKEDTSMDSAVSVKPEPIDMEYNQASGDSQSAYPATRRKSERGQITFGKSKSQIRDVMSKNRDSGAPKLRNVVDSLLQKNELLLAQNDAIAYKPNPRAPRYNYDTRKMDGGGLGETTFLVSAQSQARITKHQGKEQDVVSGRLLRPRSPTRKCSIPERDKTHLNTAILETKLNDKDSEKLFRVQKHDLVSAVSCQAMFSSKGGKIAANIDLTYYWCNFCSYSSTSKHALLNHTIEHRFTCKHCKYQSFSRADVIRHSAKNHEEFTCMATSLKYCTLLSDYLQVSSQPPTDDNKRKAETEEDDNPSKAQKFDEDTEDSTSSCGQSEKAPNNDDYEFFDMEVEEIEENNDHGVVTEELPELPENPSLPIPKLYSSNNNNKTNSPYNRAKPSRPIQSDQDILYQQYASPGTAMQILPNLDDHATVHTVSTPTTSSNNNNNKPVKPRLTPKFAQQKTQFAQQKTPPAKPTVSSSLYWSCGYCSFKSDSQWKIKHHSVSKHPGKPHRYVALILPAGTTNLNEEEDESGDKTVEVDVADESEDSNSNQSSEMAESIIGPYCTAAGILKQTIIGAINSELVVNGLVVELCNYFKNVGSPKVAVVKLLKLFNKDVDTYTEYELDAVRTKMKRVCDKKNSLRGNRLNKHMKETFNLPIHRRHQVPGVENTTGEIPEVAL